MYTVPWKARPHLARFWPDEGPFGRLEDLGALTQASDPRRPIGVNLDHVGGLVFGHDGYLYYVKSTWVRRDALPRDRRRYRRGAAAVLCRMRPDPLEHEALCPLPPTPG